MNGWAPLGMLVATDGERLERALGEAPRDAVVSAIDEVDARSSEPRAKAAIQAVRLALAIRSGESGDAVEGLAARARDALSAAGESRAASFVEAERIALIGARRERLAEAGALADAMATPDDDAELAAVVLRLRGSLARARADLRGSLLTLEQSRICAEKSGSVRELIRTYNTLGTSYAALGIGELARQWLERAREIAVLAGQRQSAAISAGQLAVLAMDDGHPIRAVRHLEAQRASCEALGDVAGWSRALSLLVEAHAESQEPELSAACAERCRAVYAASPTPWTHLQAVLATMYEAEQSLLAHDVGRATVLLASCETERTSAHPAHRVVRAREAFIVLARAALSPGPETHAEIALALEHLRRSPRPAWVERALGRAARLAMAAGDPAACTTLALRAALVREARGAAGSGALGMLAASGLDGVVPRAMALARDLVQRARLALAPLSGFEAHLIDVETDGTPGALDAAIASFHRSDHPGEPPDDLAVSVEGLTRARISTALDEVASTGALHARDIAGVTTVHVARRRLEVVVDATMGIGIRVVGDTLA